MRKLIATAAAVALGLMLNTSVFACHYLNDGEVTKIDGDKKQVVVTKGQKQHTFTTADKTKVTINGEKAALADLKSGDKVTVAYESSSDVLEIKVTREG